MSKKTRQLTMTPQQYWAAHESREKMRLALDVADDLQLKAAERCPMPPKEKLRRAFAADITVGQVLWYTNFDEGSVRHWNIVEEVLRPNDQWKAYDAHDGCMYGLDGAFVEIA